MRTIAYLRHRIRRDPWRLLMDFVFRGATYGVYFYIALTVYKLHELALGLVPC